MIQYIFHIYICQGPRRIHARNKLKTKNLRIYIIPHGDAILLRTTIRFTLVPSSNNLDYFHLRPFLVFTYYPLCSGLLQRLMHVTRLALFFFFNFLCNREMSQFFTQILLQFSDISSMLEISTCLLKIEILFPCDMWRIITSRLGNSMFMF